MPFLHLLFINVILLCLSFGDCLNKKIYFIILCNCFSQKHDRFLSLIEYSLQWFFNISKINSKTFAKLIFGITNLLFEGVLVKFERLTITYRQLERDIKFSFGNLRFGYLDFFLFDRHNRIF